MELIEIELNAPRGPSLADMLRALEPDLRELPWLVLDLGEVVPGDDLGPGPDLPERVRDSEHGVALTYPELDAFARGVSQVIDGIFLGGAQDPSRDATIADNAGRATHLLAIVDSSFWLIGGPPAMIAHARTAFPTARAVGADRLASLPYWD
jgi:hypothetical protein